MKKTTSNRTIQKHRMLSIVLLGVLPLVLASLVFGDVPPPNDFTASYDTQENSGVLEWGIYTQFYLKADAFHPGPDETTDPATVLSTWEFDDGIDANWTESPAGVLAQTVNTQRRTSFLYPEGSNFYDFIYIQEQKVATTSDDDSIGALFRFKDDNNYYSFDWVQDGGGAHSPPYRMLKKTVGGTTTLLYGDNVDRVDNVWNKIEIHCEGPLISVYIDDVLWTEVTDNSLTHGSFGPWNQSQPQSQFRNLAYTVTKQKSLNVAETSIPETASITHSMSQLMDLTVGTILATQISSWASTQGIPVNDVTPLYSVLFDEPGYFTGMVSSNGVQPDESSDNAYVYGKIKTNALWYTLERNDVELTEEPLMQQAYEDFFTACDPPAGEDLKYTLYVHDFLNSEPRTATATISRTNSNPTLLPLPPVTVYADQAFSFDIYGYIQDEDQGDTFTIAEINDYTSTEGTVLTLNYPIDGPSEDTVMFTITDCNGGTTQGGLEVTIQPKNLDIVLNENQVSEATYTTEDELQEAMALLVANAGQAIELEELLIKPGPENTFDWIQTSEWNVYTDADGNGEIMSSDTVLGTGYYNPETDEVRILFDPVLSLEANARQHLIVTVSVDASLWASHTPWIYWASAGIGFLLVVFLLTGFGLFGMSRVRKMIVLFMILSLFGLGLGCFGGQNFPHPLHPNVNSTSEDAGGMVLQAMIPTNEAEISGIMQRMNIPSDDLLGTKLTISQ